jgi:hypothetical protein
MTYPYGTQGAPAVGGGLGGLPRRAEALPTMIGYSRIVTGSGILQPIAGAKYMRVAIFGGGAGGGYISGLNAGVAGGGGGCAGVKSFVPASPISYSIGAGRAASSSEGQAGTTTASFLSYNLVATGGWLRLPANGGPSGGEGSGGEFSYTGGAGGVGGGSGKGGAGGGAAGPNGNGGKGQDSGENSPQSGFYDGGGFGPGGGGGGALRGSTQDSENAGGGGAGAPGGQAALIGSGTTSHSAFRQSEGGSIWGTVGGPGLSSSGQGYGGELGGGGRGIPSGSSAGGSGGMVVEWYG